MESLRVKTVGVRCLLAGLCDHSHIRNICTFIMKEEAGSRTDVSLQKKEKRRTVFRPAACTVNRATTW